MLIKKYCGIFLSMYCLSMWAANTEKIEQTKKEYNEKLQNLIQTHQTTLKAMLKKAKEDKQLQLRTVYTNIKPKPIVTILYAKENGSHFIFNSDLVSMIVTLPLLTNAQQQELQTLWDNTLTLLKVQELAKKTPLNEEYVQEIEPNLSQQEDREFIKQFEENITQAMSITNILFKKPDPIPFTIAYSRAHENQDATIAFVVDQKTTTFSIPGVQRLIQATPKREDKKALHDAWENILALNPVIKNKIKNNDNEGTFWKSNITQDKAHQIEKMLETMSALMTKLTPYQSAYSDLTLEYKKPNATADAVIVITTESYTKELNIKNIQNLIRTLPNSAEKQKLMTIWESFLKLNIFIRQSIESNKVAVETQKILLPQEEMKTIEQQALDLTNLIPKLQKLTSGQSLEDLGQNLVNLRIQLQKLTAMIPV